MIEVTSVGRLWVSAGILTSFLAGCGGDAAGDPVAELGYYGRRVGGEVERLAVDRFTASPEVRDQFASIYPELHHRASADEVLADLSSNPALAPLADSIHGALQRELQGNQSDTRRVRENWKDPDVQLALVYIISQGIAEASRTAPPADAPAR